LVASLLDQSLIYPSQPAAAVTAGAAAPDDDARFDMLETIREFAIERIEASGEAEATRRAHAEFYLALAERAEPELRGPAQATWLARLEADHDNIRAALGWALERGETDLGLCLVAAIWRFWWIRGHLGEGLAWLERALALEGGSPAARGRALKGAGTLAADLGDYPRAEALHQVALTLWRELGDPQGMARALDDLGNAAHDLGDLDRAVPLHEQALTLARDSGDKRGVASAANNLGMVAVYRGELARAEALFGEALTFTRELGDTFWVASVLMNLGMVALRAGDLSHATARYEESLTLSRDLADRRGIALALIDLGEVVQRQGDLAKAEALYDEARRLFEELGDQRTLAITLHGLANLALRRRDRTRAATLLAAGMALAQRVGDRLTAADCLEAVAQVIVPDWVDQAALLLGAASAVREAVGAPVAGHLRPGLDETLTAARTALGPGAFDAAYDAGRALALEQAVAEALAATEAVLRSAPTSEVSLTRPGEAGGGAPGSDLTPREREVLRLLAEGRTDREIAEALFVTTKTASNHVASILAKLGVETRTAAAAFALRHGLA
jgi:DNA-binding CsgD family transcriptional regulator